MFEFDHGKSAANKRKHGIDFQSAQALWRDPDAVIVPAKNPAEQRWLVIGQMKDKYWTAIITYRGENIRLISVRRSRAKEIDLYEAIRA